MIEPTRMKAGLIVEGEELELRRAAPGQLVSLWKEAGPELDHDLKTLDSHAAIRLDIVRAAKQSGAPRAFQREVVRQARNALEATIADHHTHPVMRNAAAFHLAELQTETGKFFAARRALKLTDESSISLLPGRVQSVHAAIEDGIRQAHLLREFRQLREESSAKARVSVTTALRLASRMGDLAQRAENTMEVGGLVMDLAREEKGQWLVEAAKKAAKKGDHQQASRLASESLWSFTRVLESADARVIARAQFDAARAHLLLAKLTGLGSHIEAARQHSSAITRRLPVRSVKQVAFIDRKELSVLRQQITITAKSFAPLPPTIRRTHLQRLAAPIERLFAAFPAQRLKKLATSCLAVTSAFTLLAAPANQTHLASASPTRESVQQAMAARAQAVAQAELIASEQAKLDALYVQRAAEQQQLDAANADYLAKKHAEDSVTGPEAAAKADREAGIENRVLGVAVGGAESDYGGSKFSGWWDAQGKEHVRVEPNGTVGIGLFQVSVPASDFVAQTPYVVRLENDLAFNASEANKSHIAPHGGRFTSFCAAYTPGHCMDGAYYLAPGTPALRFIGAAQQAVADEQAKYDAEVDAKAQLDTDQKQLDELDVQIKQERVVLRQEGRGTVLAF